MHLISFQPSALKVASIRSIPLADQDANRFITAAMQDDATTSYTVQGQNRGSSNLQLNLGADLQLNPKTVLYAGVNYQAFNNGDQFGYQGGLRYKF